MDKQICLTSANLMHVSLCQNYMLDNGGEDGANQYIIQLIQWMIVACLVVLIMRIC
jgi:hypothetical protein